MRKYSLKEVDSLRSACELRVLFGTTNLPDGGCSGVHYGNEVSVKTEEMVRTYILAGITAADLYSEDKND